MPMNVTRYGDTLREAARSLGPRVLLAQGRARAVVAGHETDLSALARGKVTITPLDYNMTRQSVLANMQRWQFPLTGDTSEDDEASRPPLPTMRIRRGRQKVGKHEQ